MGDAFKAKMRGRAQAEDKDSPGALATPESNLRLAIAAADGPRGGRLLLPYPTIPEPACVMVPCICHFACELFGIEHADASPGCRIRAPTLKIEYYAALRIHLGYQACKSLRRHSIRAPEPAFWPPVMDESLNFEAPVPVPCF